MLEYCVVVPGFLSPYFSAEGRFVSKVAFLASLYRSVWRLNYTELSWPSPTPTSTLNLALWDEKWRFRREDCRRSDEGWTSVPVIQSRSGPANWLRSLPQIDPLGGRWIDFGTVNKPDRERRYPGSVLNVKLNYMWHTEGQMEGHTDHHTSL